MTMTENDGPPKFLDELRQYAMALHTKEQAPGSGKAEAPKEQKPFKPTKAGVLRFYEESKIVYDAFEEIVQNVRTVNVLELVQTEPIRWCWRLLYDAPTSPHSLRFYPLYRTHATNVCETRAWSVDRHWPRISTTWFPHGT